MSELDESLEMELARECLDVFIERCRYAVRFEEMRLGPFRQKEYYNVLPISKKMFILPDNKEEPFGLKILGILTTQPLETFIKL